MKTIRLTPLIAIAVCIGCRPAHVPMKERTFDSLKEMLDNGDSLNVTVALSELTRRNSIPKALLPSVKAHLASSPDPKRRYRIATCIAKILGPDHQDVENAIRPVRNGESLSFAAYEGDIARIQQLISNGTNVNSRYWNLTRHSQLPRGSTPLICAALNGKNKAVQLLIDFGADPAIIDTDRQTASDYAKRECDDETIRILNECLSKNESGPVAP